MSADEYTAEYDRESNKQKMRLKWDSTVEVIKHHYQGLVDMGMPAEDARGLAPTNVLTRINYVTDLRTLLSVLDVRLCTQAQFEWRLVANLMAEAIRDNWIEDRRVQKFRNESLGIVTGRDALPQVSRVINEYTAIASLFRPICYRTGKCEFLSDADRECSIRSRVQANHDLNRPSAEWDQEYDRVEGDPIVAGFGPRSVMREEGTERPVFIGAIQPAEWMLDPSAAR